MLLIRRCLLFLLLLSFGPLHAEGFHPLIFTPGLEKLVTTGCLYKLDNSTSRYPAAEIIRGIHDSEFENSAKHAINVGYPKIEQPGDVWLALEVLNQTDRDIALWTYGVSSQSMTRAYLLPRSADQPTLTHTFAQDLRRTAKTLAIPPGTWRIYIELQREPFAYPLIVISLRTFENIIHQSPERAIILLSLGVCLALLIYNIILAINLQSRSHWLYVLYNVAIVLYLEASGQVLAEQFGLPELPQWTWFPINVSSLFFYALFVYDILNLSQLVPSSRRYFYALLACWPILLVWHIFDIPQAMRMFNALLMLATPLSIVIAWLAHRRGSPIATLLGFSICLPALGTLLGLLVNSFAPWVPLTVIACLQPIGIDLEMVLLSLTIGFKIRRHQESLRRRRDHAYQELNKIVFPHQLEQIWKGATLETTMPIGRSEAFTLVFDVIGSSRLPVADPRAFMSGVFAACSELMMENYDGQRLVANAYRVKEMGDGFICTVGFPFAAPIPESADHALRLAYRFMQIFAEHAARTGASKPLHCAVGIAYGPIEAFYPDNGTIVYDMYGRSIILANRYESMRDQLFPYLQVKKSIIILQSLVWDTLSPELQAEFTHFSLTDNKFVVKDDESATHLYYRLLD